MDFLLSACEIAEAPSSLRDMGQAAKRGSEVEEGFKIYSVFNEIFEFKLTNGLLCSTRKNSLSGQEKAHGDICP